MSPPDEVHLDFAVGEEVLLVAVAQTDGHRFAYVFQRADLPQVATAVIEQLDDPDLTLTAATGACVLHSARRVACPPA